MAVVKTETKEFVHVITMDRAEALNAFNNDMMDELCEAFLAATIDDQVRVVVLTGAGRAFSAGADLKAMGAVTTPARHGLNGLLNAIIDCPKPVIMAANGLGAGIGTTILGLGDMSFVAQGAKFRCPFSALGLTAEAGSTYTFPRLMGYQRAAWVLLSSEWLTAAECVEFGLAMASFPTEVFMSEVMSKAATLAALPLESLMQTKALLMAPRRAALKQAVIEEGEGLARLSGGPANREAIAAFLEKRAPDFS